MRHRAIAITLLALLAACGSGEEDPGPGGVTAGEAKALDEAAAMLDEQRSPAEGDAPVSAPLPPDPDASAAPAKN